MSTGRRLFIFLSGAVLWTLLACYPNPLVIGRTLARLRRPPVDPRLAQRMGWQPPARIEDLQEFVDGLLVWVPDWQAYRVPYYLPTALEAARAGVGDDKARALILASLLQARAVRYRLRASFHHLWVEYPGHIPQPGEREAYAFLTVQDGRLSLRWPRRVDWRGLRAAAGQVWWGAMPAVRRAMWLAGLVWLALLATLAWSPVPPADLRSSWRLPAGGWLSRALVLAALSLMVVALGTLAAPGARGWSPPEMKETAGYAAVLGGLLAWVSLVRPRTGVRLGEGEALTVASALGLWKREQALPRAEVRELALVTSPGGTRPWLVLAVMADGRRILMLRHRREEDARSALRWLCGRLRLPMVVETEGREIRTGPGEIGLPLRQRGWTKPPEPEGEEVASALLVSGSPEAGWALALPRADRQERLALLTLAGGPAVATLASAWLMATRPGEALALAVWVTAAVSLALVVYTAVVMREQILARLAGVRVEVAGGRLHYWPAGGGHHQVSLTEIEALEPGRVGEVPTIAVVTPRQVMHLAGLVWSDPEREWVMGELGRAILAAPVVEASARPGEDARGGSAGQREAGEGEASGRAT